MEYLRENNPDVLIFLEEEDSLIWYVNEKIGSIAELLQVLSEEQHPGYVIEEMCMNELTADLRPSKYHYIRELLQQEFPRQYHHLFDTGILRLEIINMISNCLPLFEAFGFSEQMEDDKNLRYVIVGTIKEYFELSERENRELWPIVPTIS